MLSTPNPDSAVNEEAANLFRTDKKKFDEKVIKNKMYDTEIQNLIDDNKLNKIVEWIFT